MAAATGFLQSRRLGRLALKGAAAFSMVYILLPLFFVAWLSFFAQEIPSSLRRGTR